MILKLALIYGMVGTGPFTVEHSYTHDMNPLTPCSSYVERTHRMVRKHFDELHLLHYTCTWEVHL